jgi:hypothetical protein
MKTINIKGKEYIEVNERLKYFREHYPEYSLITEILSMENGVVVMKASIVSPENRVIATGTAYEKEDSSFINKTSYIENCETSAWGRALANFGIGLDTSVASADEVQNAAQNQPVNSQPTRQANTTRRIQNPVRDEINDDSEHPCSECGSGTEYKSGVSKSGKEWKGYRCLDCGHMDWIND